MTTYRYVLPNRAQPNLNRNENREGGERQETRRKRKRPRKNQMQRLSPRLRCRPAPWKCLRPTQALAKGDRGARHLQSAEDPVVSRLREQVVRSVVAVGVDLSYLTQTPSPIRTHSMDTKSRRSVGALWMTAWMANK